MNPKILQNMELPITNNNLSWRNHLFLLKLAVYAVKGSVLFQNYHIQFQNFPTIPCTIWLFFLTLKILNSALQFLSGDEYYPKNHTRYFITPQY